jgi:ATP-dependent protease ClpP protease subunit
MTEALAKANLAIVTAERPSANVAVLKLTGSIGKGEAISERGVRQFVGTIGAAERVHLVINSEGGNVVEADRIYWILRSLPYPISAEVNMKAWSAAVTLLLAADFRWARADASILVHRTRIETDKCFAAGSMVTAPEMIERAQKLYADDEREIDLLAFRTGYDRAWFSREQSNEVLMSDQDAIRCGLLHAIEGSVPFSMDNLAVLDRMYAGDRRKPSEALVANYRAAAVVAAMEAGR